MPASHTATDSERQSVQSVVSRYGASSHALVQILCEVQSETRWLSRGVLKYVADELGLTPAIVQGVASFYHFFHLQPVGEYHFLWSDNVTDQMLGSRILARELCRLLEIRPGKLTSETNASLEFTSCTGLGDQGPALLVNQHQVLTRMNDQRVVELAELVRGRVPVAAWPAEWMRVDDQVRRSGVLLETDSSPGQALRCTLARGEAQTLEELDISRLRGSGGAGFSTAKKWRACLQAPCAPGTNRVIVCNADEGEPGTFKDRVLLSRQPDLVFDGMTVAARLVGARQGFVYLRGEYRYLLDALEDVLQRRREQQLLGRDILGVTGFDFDIGIHIGAGAYVCGEESALIESLEGKRGTPRIRPPFPVERGYLDQPTVVNNVETFCGAARIAERGGAWWAGIGTAQSTGTKLHSVSGDCERPGIYEYPYGVTIEQILKDCGANTREHNDSTHAGRAGGRSVRYLSGIARI